MALSRTLAAVATSALLVVAAGCGGSNDSSGSSSSSSATTTEKQATPAAGGTKVSISDFKFKPPSITVPVGTKLEFSNDDTAAHTATASDSSFDTGSIRKGAKASVTLKKAGTFAYICAFHPFMKGTVVVQ